MAKLSGIPQIQKNMKVLVFGVGIHGGGESVIKYLKTKGANIRVTDLRTEKTLLQYNKSITRLKGTFGRHSFKDINWSELIIKNPGIDLQNRFLKHAEKKGIPITSDLSLFFSELQRQPDIMVTGTRGKSTTTALINHLFQKTFQTNMVGNIRIAPLKTLPQKKATIQITEVSSFQIDDLHSSIIPKTAIFTNVFIDHLNRYSSYANYKKSKAKLFLRQTKSDRSVLNFDNMYTKNLKSNLKSKCYFYSLSKLPKQNIGVYAHEGNVYWKTVKSKFIICSLNDISLCGEHNLSNALAAVCVAKLHRIPSQIIRKQLQTFKTLYGRLETRRIKNEVTYINDTTSTTPQALLVAYKTLTSTFPHATLHFIAGGADKNLNFSPLKGMNKKVVQLYGLKGSANKKIRKHTWPFKDYTTLKEAFFKASRNANKGDVIILSPGAASFNMFNNEFDRGNQFNALVKEV